MNWIKKHKILTGVLVLFLLVMMTPTDDTSSTDTDSDTKDSKTSESTDTKKEETNDKVSLKINSYEDWTDTSDMGSTPSEGTTFKKVNFTIKNNSVDAGIGMNPYNFSGETTNQSLESSSNAYYDGADEPDSEVTLKAGGEKTYSLIFEVPTDDPMTELKYSDFGSGDVTAKIPAE